MRVQLRLWLLLMVCGLLAACTESGLNIIQTDPLLKVYPGLKFLPKVDDTARVARGEYATLLFVLSAKESVSELDASVEGWKSDLGLAEVRVGWVQQVKSCFDYPNSDPELLLSPEKSYPDPIITDTLWQIAKGEEGLLWVDIAVPRDAQAGLYRGSLLLTGVRNNESFTETLPFAIKVYPVTLPQQTLAVTNWSYTGAFPLMNNGKPVEDDSPAYWDCMKALVEMGARYGQNVWLLHEVGVPVMENGRPVRFDFTQFDREVELLLKHAPVKLLEGKHFAKRSNNGWFDPFYAEVAVEDGKGDYLYEILPCGDKRTKRYIKAYFAALQEHLKSKPLNDGSGRTWLDIYVQHVGDEPIVENIESWNCLACQLKKAAPELQVIEAYRTDGYDPQLIDYVVPQLDELAWDVYRTVPADHHVWFYTCMYPRGTFANRYVAQPLIKTRLLHWINFRYGATGYLHWGFNAWEMDRNPYGDVSVAEYDFPGGDSHIVYPGYRKVYPSIRLAAMRDGIADYELLKLVQSKDASQAEAFVKRMVYDFDKYNISVLDFRALRKEMLEWLSAALNQ